MNEIKPRRNELISVIIPMYQAAETIERALQSVASQTYRPLEVIVVNDGSTDCGNELAQSFFQRHEEADLVFQLVEQINQGVSSARNTGMKRASGVYIALLDADDEWLPQKLQRQYEVLQTDTNVDFIGTNRVGEYHVRWFLKKFKRVTPISSKLLLYKTFFAPSTVLFKRNILEHVGFFDEQQRYAEEGNYWIRVCDKNQCFLLNESLVHSGGGKPNFGFSGLSSNLLAMEKGELKNMRLGYQTHIVGRVEYIFLVCYSIIKYIRRIIIVKLRG